MSETGPLRHPGENDRLYSQAELSHSKVVPFNNPELDGKPGYAKLDREDENVFRPPVEGVDILSEGMSLPMQDVVKKQWAKGGYGRENLEALCEEYAHADPDYMTQDILPLVDRKDFDGNPLPEGVTSLPPRVRVQSNDLGRTHEAADARIDALAAQVAALTEGLSALVARDGTAAQPAHKHDLEGKQAQAGELQAQLEAVQDATEPPTPKEESESWLDS